MARWIPFPSFYLLAKPSVQTCRAGTQGLKKLAAKS